MSICYTTNNLSTITTDDHNRQRRTGQRAVLLQSLTTKLLTVGKEDGTDEVSHGTKTDDGTAKSNYLTRKGIGNSASVSE